MCLCRGGQLSNRLGAQPVAATLSYALRMGLRVRDENWKAAYLAARALVRRAGEVQEGNRARQELRAKNNFLQARVRQLCYSTVSSFVLVCSPNAAQAHMNVNQPFMMMKAGPPPHE